MKIAARSFVLTIAATLLGTMLPAGAQKNSAASRPEIVALDREAAQLRKRAFEALHNAINSEDSAKSARDSATHTTDPLVRASWENGAREQTKHAKEQTEAAARLNAQAVKKMAQARQLEGGPSEPMNSADAAKLRDAINGLWVDQHGKRWEIAGRDSTVSMTAIYANDHRVVYVGTWDLGLIAALHTIKDPADIEDLPPDVSAQLAATWRPAFGVNVAFHRASGQLDGIWSSQHVTYDGMDHSVKSIQDPWDQPLTLSRVNPQLKIDTIQFEDQGRAFKKTLLQSRIDDLRSQIEQAGTERDRLRHAYLKDADPAYFKAVELSKKMSELNAAVDADIQLEKAHAGSKALSNSKADVEKLTTAVQAMKPDADKARSVAAQSGSQYATAEDHIRALNADLLNLLEQERALDLQSSLEKVSVTADGKPVFSGVFNPLPAQKLQELDAFRELLAKEVAKAKQDRDAAEGAVMASSAEAQRALADLDSAMMTRGLARTLITAFHGGRETLQGAAEGGGIPGALVGLGTWAAKELLMTEVADDLELEHEVTAQLDDANRAPVSSWPIHGAEADKIGVGAQIEVGKLIYESFEKQIERAMEYVLDPFLEPFSKTGLEGTPGYSELRKLVAKNAAHLAKMKRVSSAMKKAFPPVFVVKGIPAPTKTWVAGLMNGKAGIPSKVASTAAGVASEVATVYTEQFFQSEVATAWANYVLADRSAHGLTVAYIQTSEAYRALSRALDVLVARENRFLTQQLKTSGFEQTLSVPFEDGAKVVVTTTPKLDAFSFARGSLGGEQLIAHPNGTFTVVAHGLAYRGKDPRLVTLVLSLGR